MAYDPHRHQVASLLNFNGADGATAVSDDTGRIWTVHGSAQLDTAQAAFGASSLLIGGTNGNRITCASSAAFAFGPTADFTIEGYLRATSVTSGVYQIFYDGRETVGSFPRPTIYFLGSELRYFVNGADRIAGGVATVNEWMHWAYSRKAGIGRLFLRGDTLGSWADTINYAAHPVTIGNSGHTPYDAPVRGWVDAVRITPNVGRYAGDFDVPDSEFTIRGIPVSGVVEVGAPPAPARRKIVLMRTRDLIVVGSGLSDPVTGAYEIDSDADDGDSIVGLAYPDYGEAPRRSTLYAIGDRCWVGEPAPLGHWYECEAGGTTGSSAPTWPTDGSTVTDGTVTWRDKGLIERPWAEGPYLAQAA